MTDVAARPIAPPIEPAFVRERADRAAAAAARRRRRARLAAAEPVLDAVQHRADRHLRAAAGLDRAAARQVPAHRCGVERRRAARLPAASRAHREVGACWAFVGDRLQLFHLRLLSDRRALAGRRVLRAAGVRHRLAAVARRAAPRSRRGLFLRRAADRVLRPAARLAGDRLAGGRDRAVGRPAGDPRGRRRSASSPRCRSASCWRSAAARDCRRCGCCRSSSSSSCAACR